MCAKTRFLLQLCWLQDMKRKQLLQQVAPEINEHRDHPFPPANKHLSQSALVSTLEINWCHCSVLMLWSWLHTQCLWLLQLLLQALIQQHQALHSQTPAICIRVSFSHVCGQKHRHHHWKLSACFFKQPVMQKASLCAGGSIGPFSCYLLARIWSQTADHWGPTAGVDWACSETQSKQQRVRLVSPSFNTQSSDEMTEVSSRTTVARNILRYEQHILVGMVAHRPHKVQQRAAHLCSNLKKCDLIVRSISYVHTDVETACKVKWTVNVSQCWARKYRCIDCQMHKEPQSVDQPPQYQVVAAQQVKGHLRPKRKTLSINQIFSYSFIWESITAELTDTQRERTCLPVVVLKQREEKVPGHGGVAVWGGLPPGRCDSLQQKDTKSAKPLRESFPKNKKLQRGESLSTLLRLLVLLWIRFSTTCRQWTGLSPGYAVDSAVSAELTDASFFSETGLESSWAAKARTCSTTYQKF